MSQIFRVGLTILNVYISSLAVTVATAPESLDGDKGKVAINTMASVLSIFSGLILLLGAPLYILCNATGLLGGI